MGGTVGPRRESEGHSCLTWSGEQRLRGNCGGIAGRLGRTAFRASCRGQQAADDLVIALSHSPPTLEFVPGLRVYSDGS